MDFQPIGFEEWWNRPNRPAEAIAFIDLDKPAFEAIWRTAQSAMAAECIRIAKQESELLNDEGMYPESSGALRVAKSLEHAIITNRSSTKGKDS